MTKLGIALVCAAVVAVPSVAQLSGRWEASLLILPSPPGVVLETCVLTLGFAVAPGWTLTSTSTFGTLGLTGQAFGILGAFGPLSITGGVDFNPQDVSTVTVTYPAGCPLQTESVTLTAPAYRSAWFLTRLDLLGVGVGFSLNHWAFPYTKDPADPTDVEDFRWPCCPPQTQTYTLLGLILSAPPVTFTSRFADCSTGISFRDATLTVSDASLCCGITHDIEVYFTRLGFGHLLFTTEIPLCCGISIVASVRYTVAHKTFAVQPRWTGLGQAHFDLYADVLWEDGIISGLAIYGYRLRCDFTECSYVEFLTALDVTKIEDILENEALFQGDEFQYIKLGFCGPGCCGAMYTISMAVYFQPAGTLFGFTRIMVETSIPLLANFALTTSVGVAATGAPTTLSVGWIMTF